ncbi:MAG TPA: DUF1330 domain-containing protein, partial [Xanthobacteraceae bacterium]|nr:DUF1330 domain-containing protein [Xanthobacteraceae bacterium]
MNRRGAVPVPATISTDRGPKVVQRWSKPTSGRPLRHAGPALAAPGARFLARGVPAQVYEAGIKLRMMVAEFDSVAAATACHDGPAYHAALEVFINAAERDFRIIESLESRNRTFVPGRMKPVSNRRDNASSRARAASREVRRSKIRSDVKVVAMPPRWSRTRASTSACTDEAPYPRCIGIETGGAGPPFSIDVKRWMRAPQDGRLVIQEAPQLPRPARMLELAQRLG